MTLIYSAMASLIIVSQTHYFTFGHSAQYPVSIPVGAGYLLVLHQTGRSVDIRGHVRLSVFVCGRW